MPARYSVIQYLPDPATDERINFGVLAFGKDEIHARFVRSWGRIGSFGGPDIAFLKSFAKQVEAATSAQTNLALEGGRLDEEALRRAAGKWVNSIQLTEPRGSTLEPSKLVDQVARRFLRERVASVKRGRDRRVAIGAASRSLATALRAGGIRKPEKYVRPNEVVAGEHDDHQFGLALANGAPQLGVLAMSFEGVSPAYLAREVRANAWTIDDVRNSVDLPIAVVTLPPPSGHSKTYDHAVDLFESLEADVVPEREINDWASDVVPDLYDALISRVR